MTEDSIEGYLRDQIRKGFSEESRNSTYIDIFARKYDIADIVEKAIIEVFMEEDKKYNFFKNKSPEWWKDQAKFNSAIQKKILPQALGDLYNAKLLTKEEWDNLLLMVISPDLDNLVVVVTVIEQKRKLLNPRRWEKKQV